MSMHEKSIDMKIKSYMYNELETIDDPISDSYLPYSQNVFKGIKTPEDINNEYTVISIFKSVLNRNPTQSEIDKYADELKENNIDETILKVNLINSTEYKRNFFKMLSNYLLFSIQQF